MGLENHCFYLITDRYREYRDYAPRAGKWFLESLDVVCSTSCEPCNWRRKQYEAVLNLHHTLFLQNILEAHRLITIEERVSVVTASIFYILFIISCCVVCKRICAL